jgi:hypothetical protein
MIGTMWAIARATGGISLNGDEYLMDGNGEILVFDSEQKALRTIAELFPKQEAETVFPKLIEVELGA